MKQNTPGPELRNQTESQSDGFGEAAGATAGHENTGDRNGDFTDQDKAIRERPINFMKEATIRMATRMNTGFRLNVS